MIGDQNLRPEYANSYQVGSEFTSLNWRVRFSVNIFRNDIEDLIDSVNLGFVATPQQLQAVVQREGIGLTVFSPALGRYLGKREEIARVQFLGAFAAGTIRKMRPMKAPADCRSQFYIRNRR